MKFNIFTTILVISFIFSSFCSFGTIVKPLTGERFQEGNQIQWTVDQSDDIQFFILQRSVDGIHFSPIATIQTTKISTCYSFLDKHAANKNWFYRVINVKQNGVGDFSEALLLK